MKSKLTLGEMIDKLNNDVEYHERKLIELREKLIVLEEMNNEQCTTN